MKWHWTTHVSMPCVIFNIQSREKRASLGNRYMCLFAYSLLLPPLTLDPTFFLRGLPCVQSIHSFVIVHCLKCSHLKHSIYFRQLYFVFILAYNENHNSSENCFTYPGTKEEADRQLRPVIHFRKDQAKNIQARGWLLHGSITFEV